MDALPDFISELEAKVSQQLRSRRVGYLLGAGSSYLNGAGYPMASEIWDQIKGSIPDPSMKEHIQAKLDAGATGIESALDLLDDGGANDTPYRHLVTSALAELFMPMEPPLDLHIEFVKRLSLRSEQCVKVFSLNYDPLIERAASFACIRLVDGFSGSEPAYFDSAVFEERIGRIRGTHRAKQFEETVKPIHLLKLHGSLGWYECSRIGVRRCGFASSPPNNTRRLMIPPQRRKASDTMYPPYSSLWSAFRGSLGQDSTPLNRLVCVGYGFADEHVNSVIEGALARTDFTVLVFAMALNEEAWIRWSVKRNTILVTRERCSLKGQVGPGHPDLWSFERLAREI